MVGRPCHNEGAGVQAGRLHYERAPGEELNPYPQQINPGSNEFARSGFFGSTRTA